jgi:hypothetical protein
MTNSLPREGNSFPRGGAVLDRLAFFRGTYIAVFALVLLYVITVGIVTQILDLHFNRAVTRAVDVDPGVESVVVRIHSRVRNAVERSFWVRTGGVEVHAIVLGQDNLPIYAPGLRLPQRPPVDLEAIEAEADRVLPVRISLAIGVPHSSLVANVALVGYAALILTGLYFRQRSQVLRQAALLRTAMQEREEAAGRAGRIEDELEGVRRRVFDAALTESEHAREIDALRTERVSLRGKLEDLEHREADLLAQQAASTGDLEDEHQALEELLDEALGDLQTKDEAIQQLQTELKRASRDASAKASSRAREADHLGRRLRALYRNLEVDDRALTDLVALRDEGMKLKAEEALKKLSDDVGTAGARRKVGGLPPGLPVFELGYAGKGRVYYTHGAQRRLRILCIGAKNTQKPDLEYLSRIVKA